MQVLSRRTVVDNEEQVLGVAVDEGRIVGTARIDGRTWLADLWVAKDYRRCGIGRRLMMAMGAEARANGEDELCLAAKVDNDGAIAFYTRLGLEVTWTDETHVGFCWDLEVFAGTADAEPALA